MGKIKEKRFKLHQKAKGKTNEANTSNTSQDLPLAPIPDDLFAGVNINFSDVKKFDIDLDAKSLSGRSRREVKLEEQNLPKKEKIRRRHERFMLKLSLIQQMKKEMKAKGKKKTPKSEDKIPLLEQLHIEPKLNAKVKPKKVVARACMKAKKRQKEHLKDVKLFNKVLNDKAFASDPIKSITTLLKQKVANQSQNLNTQ